VEHVDNFHRVLFFFVLDYFCGEQANLNLTYQIIETETT
jgi:hypothetical protein